MLVGITYPKFKQNMYGIETVSFLGFRLCNNLPNEWKNFQTIIEFKIKDETMGWTHMQLKDL